MNIIRYDILFLVCSGRDLVRRESSTNYIRAFEKNIGIIRGVLITI